MNIVIILILGYLIGSIPFALVIGKVFYKTDIRKYGSGNLGGGNTGRVLGKKAGLVVMTLDILKVSLVVGIANWLCQNEHNVATWIYQKEFGMAIGGIAAAIGHCYPIFAKLKGGKAVATMYGFLFGLIVFTSQSLLLFLLPLVVFLITLYITKIIALASIVSATAITLYFFFVMDSVALSIALLCFTLLIIVRHRENLKRIINGTENKITWM